MRNTVQAPLVPIRSVDELVAALLKGPQANEGYLKILERIDIPPEDFLSHCTWNEKHYTRNCLVRNGDFELLLICYGPGQRTSIHDYDTQEAWVHPVIGSVIEERYQFTGEKGLRKVSSAKLESGSFSYMHNGRSIHRYINPTDDRSVTLNLYAKPLNKWKVYDERSDAPVERPADPA